MAVKPKIVTLTNSSVDILNAIRNSASTNYRDYVPVATADPETIRTIGAVIMDYPALQNEFLNALVNRIGRVLVTSKMYENPWSVFKRGMLEMGETIEEIFVNIAKPFQYDPEVAESKIFERKISDVRAAFHVMNYKKFYKATVQREDLRMAFLSVEGVTSLISKIIESMYTGANYDEFQTMKYLLARHILNGHLKPVTIQTVSAANMKSIVSTVKAVSNNMEFLSTEYNMAGVANNTLKANQYIIVDTRFDASMDVEVLASAFNMNKAEFMGRRVLVDGFGTIDNDRLAELFADDDTYVALTDDELTALSAVPAVLVDADFFMIFDNLVEFDEQKNGEGLYWQYWYHVWKTFSVSPFANSAVFVPGTPDVDSVTVSPAAATVMPGQTVNLSATVATEYFASKAVNWSVDDEDEATVDAAGNVRVSKDATPGGTIVITAKSVFDNTVTGTCTLTVYEEDDATD